MDMAEVPMTLSMIPSGQPYGQRQENEEAAAEAGLSNRVQQAKPQPIRQAQPRQQGEFDAISSRNPTSSGQLRPDGDSRVVNLLETSPSPALRDLARRLRGS